MAPWHSVIYLSASFEASWWLVLGEVRITEKKRFREWGVAAGMIVSGSYLLAWHRTADADSTTAIFCSAFLFTNLVDVEESKWLLKTAFGNHATLMFAWFSMNMGAALFPRGWYVPNACKLAGHAVGSVLWLIVAGRLPASNRPAFLPVQKRGH
jgi:hypothetical protein